MTSVMAIVMGQFLSPVAKLGDTSSAVESFTRAMELAKLLGDTQMLAGIKKALAECNSQIVEDLKQPPQQEEETKEESSQGDTTKQQPPTVTIQE